MAHRAAYTKELIKILTDGEWHSLEELVDKAGSLIPPGQAWRTTEEQRLKISYRKEKGPGRPRKVPIDDAVAIYQGRKTIVRYSLYNLTNRGTIEKRDFEDTIVYRILNGDGPIFTIVRLTDVKIATALTAIEKLQECDELKRDQQLAGRVRVATEIIKDLGKNVSPQYREQREKVTAKQAEGRKKAKEKE